MGDVIYLKGQSMTENVAARFLQAVLDMRELCKKEDVSKISFTDEEGRVYSASALMHLVDRHMNYIRASMGEIKPSQSRAGLEYSQQLLRSK